MQALAGQPDALAVGDALGDLHRQRAARGKRDRARRAVEGILERDLDRRALVLARVAAEAAHVAHVEAAAATTAAKRCAATEQRREEIGKIRPAASATTTTATEAARATAAAAREMLFPLRRRLEILPGLPVGAELVVGLALLRIRQDLVGLVGFLEPVFRALRLVLVRVELLREFSVRALDVLRRSIAANTENLVVVLEFHERCQPERARIPGVARKGSRAGRDPALRSG